jgi:hypothetical protein
MAHLEFKDPPKRGGANHKMYELLIEKMRERPDQFLYVSFDWLEQHDYSGIDTLRHHGPASYLYQAFKKLGVKVTCSRDDNGIYLKEKKDAG